ncbi:alpha-amylase family glycosyl hydrolase [Dyella sp. A6]|uniref:alpha-amylase family glycosyl hydrolase n=1 Tax=Dyella aluminiiresistens TaxID=3069105 RepID=UPI002E787EC9|nr:alpha-amylase family glycosyl hydrolase [Dyella sp. A6]
MIRRRTVTRLFVAMLALGIGYAQPARATTPTPAVASKTAPSDVYYEIFVRSWYDTNHDGIGDLNGVTAKLDYLKSLGVDGIWLMPINASPSYHGYDITNYEAINPQYGTMQGFHRLIAAAHKRGIKVIMDMVINHTSDQHPWFKAALNPRDPHHNWYVWAKPGTDLHALSPTYGPAWHRAPNGQYYLGVFDSHMPDLNYDNPAVRKAMIGVGQFWLRQGVDGFRLDAAQHIYDNFLSDMHSPVALAKNLAWWREYDQGLKKVDPNVWLVGEVWRQNPDNLTPYMGKLNAVFNFPLSTQLLTSVEQERDLGIGRGMAYVDAAYRKEDGGHFDDAPFLSNHDQERVMSQLGGNMAHMRVAAALLMTVPGHAFVYYGEELGMRGQKPDPHLREPMRWYRSGNGPGQTHWEPWTAGDGPQVSVQAEQADPHSLLNLYRTLIGWRKQVSALRDGVLHAYPVDDVHVVAYTLQDAQSHVLVVHNLSGRPRTIAVHGSGGDDFGRILLQTGATATLHHGSLHLPPYTTMILH